MDQIASLLCGVALCVQLVVGLVFGTAAAQSHATEFNVNATPAVWRHFRPITYGGHIGLKNICQNSRAPTGSSGALGAGSAASQWLGAGSQLGRGHELDQGPHHRWYCTPR
jgi:hypothetical protein